MEIHLTVVELEYLCRAEPSEFLLTCVDHENQSRWKLYVRFRCHWLDIHVKETTDEDFNNQYVVETFDQIKTCAFSERRFLYHSLHPNEPQSGIMTRQRLQELTQHLLIWPEELFQE